MIRDQMRSRRAPFGPPDWFGCEEFEVRIEGLWADRMLEKRNRVGKMGGGKIVRTLVIVQ